MQILQMARYSQKMTSVHQPSIFSSYQSMAKHQMRPLTDSISGEKKNNIQLNIMKTKSFVDNSESQITIPNIDYSQYLSVSTQRENELVSQRLIQIPDKRVEEFQQDYQRSEDGAAQLYIDFQKVFVRLNSILRTNNEGLISLEDGIPGYFDLQERDTAHFCFNNDADLNPKQIVKIATHKLYGRVAIYCSEISKMPTKANASCMP